jgi:hypothetical protein
MAPVRPFARIVRRLSCLPAARIVAAAVPFWALTATLPMVPPAAATGTLYCTIDDRYLGFELLGNTRSDDGTIVQVQHGSLRLKPGRYARQAAAFDIAQDNIVLQWSFDRDLRFAVHVTDPERHQSIYLAIIAQRDERRGKYLGRYVLQFIGARGARVVRGRIKGCEGD